MKFIRHLQRYKARNAMSSKWDASKEALRHMEAEEAANKLSVGVAAVLVDSLSRHPNRPAPVLSLDADGDVVLTWHLGRLKGSAIISGEKYSSVVSDGRKIAYVGPERVINHLVFDSAEFIGFGGNGECTFADRMEANASITSTMSDVKSFFLTWDNHTRESTAPLGTLTSSNSVRATESELPL